MGAAVAIALLTLASFARPIPSHEVMKVASPDGNFDAVLVAVPRDANDSSSFRVCLRATYIALRRSLSCPELAYIAGATGNTASRGVRLVWASKSELQIHVEVVNAIHVYRPYYLAHARRTSLGVPIYIKVVHDGAVAAAAMPLG